MMLCWLTQLVKIVAQCQATTAVVSEAGLIICRNKIEFVDSFSDNSSSVRGSS